MNYTRAEYLAFYERQKGGEVLPPKIAEKLEKFLEKERERNESIDNRGGSIATGGDVPAGEAGKQDDQTGGTGSTGTDGSGNPSGPTGDAPSGTESVKQVDPAALVDGLVQGASAPTPNRPKIEAPPPKEKPRRGRPANESRVGLTPDERKKEKARESGRQFADMLVMTGYTFLGPEWNYLPPIKDAKTGEILQDERKEFREAYADMFEAYGWDYIPPWAKAAGATAGFALVRLRMPQTQEKIKKHVPSILNTVKGWFSRKPKPQVIVVSQEEGKK